MFRLPAAATVGLLAASCRSFSPGHAPGFHGTAITLLKEIHADKVDKTLVIQGITVPSPRKVVLVRNKSECCSLCSLNLNVKHTDVLILSQFLRSDGCMLPQRVTGLCKTQQKIMSKLVSMAHKAGLMCNIAPENSKKNPTKRRDWKKYNTYYDESTIKVYENHFNIKKKDIILKYAQSKNI